MTIVKSRGGRYTAKLKSGRSFVASKTFDTRREATAWLARERASLVGGIDPRAGRRPTRDVLAEWLEVRAITVAKKTLRADQDLMRVLPAGILAMQVGAVTSREVARWFEVALAGGLSESSVARHRASFSTFFQWCVREKLVPVNPVTGVRVPRSSKERTEMQPWTEAELELAYASWQRENAVVADLLLVLGWTGLRWAEARALRVEDLVEVPTPGLLVRRSDPEGVGTKSTKGRRSRRVPVADRVLPIVHEQARGKSADALLLTTGTGAQLHRTSVLRSVRWTRTGEGRRIHDLRHTAACLWLARGVDPGTVQAWMGHESIATTNRYLHFLGTSADEAGLNRLNEPARSPGYAGGTPADEETELHA